LTPVLSKRLVAEVIGTFGFFFAGFCGIATLLIQGPTTIQAIGVAAGFGFGLTAMIFAFGHISGGHYNPAVTLGLACARRFPMGEVLPYWAAQLVGGFIAAGALRVLFNEAALDATVNAPGRLETNAKVFALELIFTFLFLLVVTTVATDKRAPWNGVFAPFAIGLFIFTAATVVGPDSGGSFNPARSIAPAVLAGNYTDLWIYILAPLAGGAIGGLVHTYFREPEVREQSGTAVQKI
jgi:aquaporin NIP